MNTHGFSSGGESDSNQFLRKITVRSDSFEGQSDSTVVAKKFDVLRDNLFEALREDIELVIKSSGGEITSILSTSSLQTFCFRWGRNTGAVCVFFVPVPAGVELLLFCHEHER